MARTTNKTMSATVKDARTGIANSASNPEVMTRLNHFGITVEELNEKELERQVIDQLLTVGVPKRTKSSGFSVLLSGRIKEVTGLSSLYMKVFKRDSNDNLAILKEMNLDKAMAKKPSGKVSEAKVFYTNCLGSEKLTAYVAGFGLTPEIMQAELQKIDSIEADDQYRAQLVSDSQHTTDHRNKLFSQFNNWWINFKTILKYVFRDDPQKLEAFKILAYSEGYKPKRKSKTKTKETPGNEEPPTVEPPAVEEPPAAEEPVASEEPAPTGETPVSEEPVASGEQG